MGFDQGSYDDGHSRKPVGIKSLSAPAPWGAIVIRANHNGSFIGNNTLAQPGEGDAVAGRKCPGEENLAISFLHPLPILKGWAAASASHFPDSLIPLTGAWY